MKYVVLLLVLMISNQLLAQATCASLFEPKVYSEAQINVWIRELRDLRSNLLNSRGNAHAINHRVFINKINELSLIMSRSEIDQRLKNFESRSQITQSHLETPKHKRFTDDELFVMDYLSKIGATSLEARNESDQTPLLVAIRNNDAQAVKALLAVGANKDVTYKRVKDEVHSALHAAVEAYGPTVLKLLLEAGANLKAVDNQGNTALHMIAKTGNDAMTEVIVKYAPAEIYNMKNKADYTAFDEAALRGSTHTRVALEILKHGPTVDLSLFSPAYDGQLNLVKEVVNKGVDINLQDQNGETALHKAARKLHGEVVEYLVAQGADITIKNKNGESAYDLAFKNRGNDFWQYYRAIDPLSSTDFMFKVKRYLKQKFSRKKEAKP